MLKPHKIYKNIITELNNYFHFKEGQGIKLITTYVLKGETLWLVSASDFYGQELGILKINNYKV